jgi:H+/gluconate symporter-like permease
VLEVLNNYDMSEYSGKKTFVLSTTNLLGGKNYFMAISYLFVGILCIVFAVVFAIAYLSKKSAIKKTKKKKEPASKKKKKAEETARTENDELAGKRVSNGNDWESY